MITIITTIITIGERIKGLTYFYTNRSARKLETGLDLKKSYLFAYEAGR